jgi:MFS family permease
MTRPPDSRPTADSPSIWSTLRHPAFRGIWLASALYFIANAMHVMAAAWIMVDRAGSSFLAALVQTAVFLPMFALSLPAGVLADTTDRRRLILLSLAVQGAAVLLLALLLVLGWAGPATILLLTFVAGCCIAVMSPAWNSAIAEILPREQLPQAIVAVGIAYNAARALGPTAAGLIYAVVSAWVLADAGQGAAPAAGVAAGAAAARAAGWAGGTVLLLALAGVLVLAWAMNHWPARPHPPSRLPPERLWGGTLAGLRYAWHSEMILAQLLRTAAYGAAGSALWALLPAIGAQRLGSGAEGYGLMMGCLGGGAVVVGLGIGPLRQRLGLEGLVATACVVFASAMAIAALSRWSLPVYLALAAAGGAWMSVMSTFNTATQTSAPPWVRSRATALHVLSALGSFALGSAFWGAVAGVAGLQAALLIAAALLLAGLLLARPFPLRMGQADEVRQMPFKALLVADEPDPEAGPVAVELIYRVRPDDVAGFLAEAEQLRAPRQRDGATFWRLYRDLDERTRYVERFIVHSWAEYLRQRERATEADRALQARVNAFLADGERVQVRHYLAER